MKTSRFFVSTSLLLLGVASTSAQTTAPAAPPKAPEGQTAVAPPANAVIRIWHDAQGRPLEATFRGLEGENVFLQAKNGFVYRLSLAKLAPADQQIAKTLKPEGLGIPADPNLAQAAAKIDEIVELALKAKNVAPNALTSDEQFVRRVYLDLAGRIPTKEEAQAFLMDTSSSKRAKVIDKLVSSEGFTSRMFNYFSDMLRMADEAQKAKFFTYEEWFKKQLAANRPWDQIVRDMMTADGKMLENGAAGYLLRDKGMRLDNLSLTLSTFMGANVACAQCHDHPFAEWTQRQFFEMAAFFGSTETYNAKGGNMGMRELKSGLTEQEMKQAKKLFQVNGLNIHDTGRNEVELPDDYKYSDGKPGDTISPKLVTWSPADAKLSIYRTAEAALNVKPAAKGGKSASDTPVNPRDVFATWMTSPENPRFAMTIANRLWKLVFGIAVKEPINDLDAPQEASNPLLLQHLAKEMVRLKFDIRAYMRLLCNTQTYQREAVTRQIAPGEPYYFPGPSLRRMTAEQAWDSCVTLAIGERVDGYKLQRADTYAEVMLLSGSAITADDVRTKLANMKQAMKGGQVAAAGKPGKKKNKKAAAAATAMSEDEDPDHKRPDVLDGLVLARASELPQPEREQHFLRMFGQSDRQIADSNTDEGSIPQVLMLMNGEAQRVLRNEKSLVLSTAVTQQADAQKIASLYLSFFSRMPRPDEMEAAKEALQTGISISDLTWVLFNAREFVFVQ